MRLVRGVHILTLERNFLFRSLRRFALFFSNSNGENRHGPVFAHFFVVSLHPMIDRKSAWWVLKYVFESSRSPFTEDLVPLTGFQFIYFLREIVDNSLWIEAKWMNFQYYIFRVEVGTLTQCERKPLNWNWEWDQWNGVVIPRSFTRLLSRLSKYFQQIGAFNFSNGKRVRETSSDKLPSLSSNSKLREEEKIEK